MTSAVRTVVTLRAGPIGASSITFNYKLYKEWRASHCNVVSICARGKRKHLNMRTF